MTKAFSLFELLITMAIMGILAAISYPLYTQHVMRINCNQAKIALLEIANQIEQEHSISGSYAHLDIDALLPHYARTLPYRFYFSVATKQHYVANAAAIKLNNANTACQLLSVSDTAI